MVAWWFPAEFARYLLLRLTFCIVQFWPGLTFAGFSYKELGAGECGVSENRAGTMKVMGASCLVEISLHLIIFKRHRMVGDSKISLLE